MTVERATIFWHTAIGYFRDNPRTTGGIQRLIYHGTGAMVPLYRDRLLYEDPAVRRAEWNMLRTTEAGPEFAHLAALLRAFEETHVDDIEDHYNVLVRQVIVTSESRRALNLIKEYDLDPESVWGNLTEEEIEFIGLILDSIDTLTDRGVMVKLGVATDGREVDLARWLARRSVRRERARRQEAKQRREKRCLEQDWGGWLRRATGN